MRRGTTPTHVFKTDIDLTTVEALFITYKQGSKTVLEKTIDDVTIETDKVTTELTQQDTLAMSSIGEVSIQIRAKFPDGTAVASQIMKRPAKEILKNGVI